MKYRNLWRYHKMKQASAHAQAMITLCAHMRERIFIEEGESQFLTELVNEVEGKLNVLFSHAEMFAGDESIPEPKVIE